MAYPYVIIDAVKKGISGGIQSLVGNTSEAQGDSHSNEAPTPVERAASPSDPRRRPTHKRQRERISSAERRIYPHFEAPTSDSTQISVPHNDWTVNVNMQGNGKRRVGAGQSHRPRNTLNNSTQFVGNGATQLSTVSNIGFNVEVPPPAKRKKLDHHTTSTKSDDWFDRQTDDPVNPREFSRRESVTSAHSHVSLSQEHRFRATEFENVNSKLAPHKPKGRKPRRFSPANSQHDFGGASSPTTPGTRTAPIYFDDDDEEPQEISSGVAQSAHKHPTRTSDSRITQSSPVRSFSSTHPAHEAKGDSRNRVSMQDRDANTNGHVSPPLSQMFKRDNDPPPPQKMRNRMRATSKTKPPGNPESSEDELARTDHTVRSAAQLAASRQIKRVVSPSGIVASQFFNTNPKTSSRNIESSRLGTNVVPLKMLAMKSYNSENDTLVLIFSPEHKRMFFMDVGETVEFHGRRIEVVAKHAQRILFSNEDLNGLLLKGAVDEVTGGSIWLDFKSREDRDLCKKALETMTDKSDAFRSIHDAQLEFHKNTMLSVQKRRGFADDPEHQAMQNRQSRGSATRERAVAAQKGIILPDDEPAASTPRPRRSIMQTDFANKPPKSVAEDAPPPEQVRMEPAQSTRSSRRIQENRADSLAKPLKTDFEQWTKINGLPDWDSPLISGGATVVAQDIERLDDGEFLNDNIITFCLRRLQEENTHLQDKIHIFDTFFYSRLSTTDERRRGLNYDAVKRWTRNVDIFTKPFVLVPVNANFHWFLLIICNLDKLERTLKAEDEEDEEPECVQVLPPTQHPRDLESPNDQEIPESPKDPKEGLSQEVGRMSLSSDETVGQTGGDKPLPGKSKTVHRTSEKKPQGLNPNTPSIITLDSLGGQHSVEVRRLKEYVALEGAEKRGFDFDYTVLKGVIAKGIPHQTNFYDCGVYLVGYVAELFKNPAEFVRKVLSRELDRNNDFADFDPAQKRSEIRDLLLKLAEEQKVAKKEARRARKREKRDALGAEQSSQQTPTRTSIRDDSKSDGPRSSPMKPSTRSPLQAPESSITLPPSSSNGEDGDMLFQNETTSPKIQVSAEGFDAEVRQAALQSQAVPQDQMDDL